MTNTLKRVAVHLFLDGSRGVYIPQAFAETINPTHWQGLDGGSLQILAKGPDNALYWPTWDEILNSARYIDIDGTEYVLHHDGDLFMVAPELMSEEEKRNFNMDDGEITTEPDTDPYRVIMAELRKYADAVGDNWKQSLLLDWSRAGTSVRGIEWSHLQVLRNTKGPSWLETFTFEEA